MNAPFHASIQNVSAADSFDRLRLQMLDAFYDLDSALEDWIYDGKGSAAGASTGCRLKELTAITFPETVATKAQAKRLANLTTELDDAIKLRNIVVHSKPSFGSVEGRPTLFLQTVGYRHGQNDLFTHKSLEDVVRAIETARLIAKSIGGWRRQRDSKATAAETIQSTPG